MHIEQMKAATSAFSSLWLWCGWATARDGSKLGFSGNPLLEIEQLSQDKDLIFTISSFHLSNPRVHVRASASPVCTGRGRAWCWKDSSTRFSTTLNDSNHSIRPIWRSGARAGRSLPDTRWETSQLTARWVCFFVFFKSSFSPQSGPLVPNPKLGSTFLGKHYNLLRTWRSKVSRKDRALFTKDWLRHV